MAVDAVSPTGQRGHQRRDIHIHRAWPTTTRHRGRVSERLRAPRRATAGRGATASARRRTRCRTGCRRRRRGRGRSGREPRGEYGDVRSLRLASAPTVAQPKTTEHDPGADADGGDQQRLPADHEQRSRAPVARWRWTVRDPDATYVTDADTERHSWRSRVSCYVAPRVSTRARGSNGQPPRPHPRATVSLILQITSKLDIIPMSSCSSLWQCSRYSPR
jgi:hypothetical protein